MKNPKHELTGERKALYYVGMGLLIIGFLLFLSTFVSAATGFGDFNNFETRGQSMAIRAILGIGLVIAGGILMSAGARGLAGSGVILDPQRTRTDLEPWSRAAGGMVRDALDEAKINLDQSLKEGGLSFDEKLRRLEQLHKDGLINEDEYQSKRQEILSERW